MACGTRDPHKQRASCRAAAGPQPDLWYLHIDGKKYVVPDGWAIQAKRHKQNFQLGICMGVAGEPVFHSSIEGSGGDGWEVICTLSHDEKGMLAGKRCLHLLVTRRCRSCTPAAPQGAWASEHI